MDASFASRPVVLNDLISLYQQLTLDDGTDIRCQLCRVIGHNRKDCPMFQNPLSERNTQLSFYLCNICKVPGHAIKDCPSGRPLGERLTPYQGPKRCMGEFKCLRCNRKWTSTNSWAQTAQQCSKCQVLVYPYKQKALDFTGEKKDVRQAMHRQELCQMCRRNGRYCGEPALNTLIPSNLI